MDMMERQETRALVVSSQSSSTFYIILIALANLAPDLLLMICCKVGRQNGYVLGNLPTRKG
ncbi:hypothetical protein GGS20DRAFT_584456 [Poronia punctata]|nr:hypothetical protein GGS20DRAFT_584456 [Poronia punctata]